MRDGVAGQGSPAITRWDPLDETSREELHMRSPIRQAIGLSFANTFGVLDIRKDFIDPDVLQNLPGWLKVVSAIQTIFGIVLLFLFGLGIRNRFRMK
jgi:hypothetical protein